MRVFEEHERDTISQPLKSGMSCQDVAGKWDCDPTQLYRKLRQWKLDTKGNDVKKPKPLDAKRRWIVDYVEMHQRKITIQQVAQATGFSWELVKEVLVDRGISLDKKTSRIAAERKRQLLLAKHHIDNGVSVAGAIKLVGMTSRLYYEWQHKLGLFIRKNKKAPE